MGPPSSLPIAATPFVGRAEQLHELRRLIAAPGLVTLVGAPGVGKTRLALEVARACGEDQTSFWVDLTATPAQIGTRTESRTGTDSLTAPGLVAEALAAAMRVLDNAGSDAFGTVAAHLGASRVLVVLDNCEHVADASAVLAGALVRACPNLTIVATSRQALGVEGEHVFELPPLDPPDARELFYQRAGATQAGFSVDDDAAAAVSDICEHLEGIPLAIELAAGRVGMLPVTEIAARLRADALGLLAGGSRGRHQTLRTALDGSFSLLSDDEAALLRGLSVFAGSFDAAMVDQICGGAELLDGLVAKSLVVRAGDDYRLLAAVHAAAKARLVDAGEGEDTRSRHLAWCVALAEEVEPGLTGPDQLGALARIDAAIDNLRAAYTRALASPPDSMVDAPKVVDPEAADTDADGEAALRIAAALTVWWRIRGRFGEGRRWIESALDRSPEAPSQLCAKALWGAGFLAQMLDAVRAATARLEESLRVYRDLGDVQGQARALLLLGSIAMNDGASSEALGRLKRSTALAQQVGDGWCRSHALALAAMVLQGRSRTAEARAAAEEGMALARVRNDLQGLRINLQVIGELDFIEGKISVAEQRLAEALAVVGALGEPYGLAAAHLAMAHISMGSNDPDRAETELDASLGATRAFVGDLETTFEVELGLGRVAFDRRDSESAREHFNRALTIANRHGRLTSDVLWGLGAVAFQEGDHPEARRLFDAALSAANQSGIPQAAAPVTSALAELARAEGHPDQAITLWRRALGQWQELHNPGRALDALEAIACLERETGAGARAARLLGAARALRRSEGCDPSPSQRRLVDACVVQLRAQLPAEEFDEAWRKGAAMSMGRALGSAIKGHRRRGTRAKSGWASLTGAEQEIVRLISEGRTNRQIAESLSISVHTVHTHVANVFGKLGVSSRTELSSEATRSASVPDV